MNNSIWFCTSVFGVLGMILTCYSQELRETKYGNGQVKEQYSVKLDDQGNDKKDGRYIAWYESGQKALETNFINDSLDGRYIAWYESGQKGGDCNYWHGKLDGYQVTYYENGQKQQESYFKKGIKIGLHTQWDYKGHIKAQVEYNNGQLAEALAEPTKIHDKLLQDSKENSNITSQTGYNNTSTTYDSVSKIVANWLENEKKEIEENNLRSRYTQMNSNQNNSSDDSFIGLITGTAIFFVILGILFVLAIGFIILSILRGAARVAGKVGSGIAYHGTKAIAGEEYAKKHEKDIRSIGSGIGKLATGAAIISAVGAAASDIDTDVPTDSTVDADIDSGNDYQNDSVISDQTDQNTFQSQASNQPANVPQLHSPNIENHGQPFSSHSSFSDNSFHDMDGDGIPDQYDHENNLSHAPNNQAASFHQDLSKPWLTPNDGIPDNLDRDFDNDGISDNLDRDINNNNVTNKFDGDIDNDGTPDKFDHDIDNDGLPDKMDLDIDNDGIPNNLDRDNDGFLNRHNKS